MRLESVICTDISVKVRGFLGGAYFCRRLPQVARKVLNPWRVARRPYSCIAFARVERNSHGRYPLRKGLRAKYHGMYGRCEALS